MELMSFLTPFKAQSRRVQFPGRGGLGFASADGDGRLLYNDDVSIFVAGTNTGFCCVAEIIYAHL